MHYVHLLAADQSRKSRDGDEVSGRMRAPRERQGHQLCSKAARILRRRRTGRRSQSHAPATIHQPAREIVDVRGHSPAIGLQDLQYVARFAWIVLAVRSRSIRERARRSA